jgi:hypothetical protein
MYVCMLGLKCISGLSRIRCRSLGICVRLHGAGGSYIHTGTAVRICWGCFITIWCPLFHELVLCHMYLSYNFNWVRCII